MLTTGHVRVRVMPSIIWTLLTTMRPSSSTVSASARAITSLGPVTSSALATPATARACSATVAAVPTSVWMRMYALTAMGALLRSRWRGMVDGGVAFVVGLLGQQDEAHGLRDRYRRDRRPRG